MLSLFHHIFKVFKLADLTLALIAIHLILIQNLILSVSSSIWTFYIALPFYSVNSLAIVGVRSYISKLVESNELGKTFTCLTVFDSITPFISSIIISPLFSMIIDTQPNLTFVALCISLIVGIGLLFIVAFRSKRTLEALELDRKNHQTSRT